jgi:hypothetical protein
MLSDSINKYFLSFLCVFLRPQSGNFIVTLCILECKLTTQEETSIQDQISKKFGLLRAGS